MEFMGEIICAGARFLNNMWNLKMYNEYDRIGVQHNWKTAIKHGDFYYEQTRHVPPELDSLPIPDYFVDHLSSHQLTHQTLCIKLKDRHLLKLRRQKIPTSPVWRKKQQSNSCLHHANSNIHRKKGISSKHCRRRSQIDLIQTKIQLMQLQFVIVSLKIFKAIHET